jgi:hypothetical protein
MTEQQPAAPPAPPKNATEARAVLDARMADKDWGGRVFNGEPAANKELHELTAMVAAGGDDTVAVAMTGNPVFMPNTDMAAMAHTAAWLREMGIRSEVIKEVLEGRPSVTAREYELVTNFKKEKMGNAEFVRLFLSGDIKARQQLMLADSILVNGVKGEAAA